MRTTFSDMHLFTSAPQKHDTTFILNGKKWGVGKTERERERVRGRVWVERVAVHKLDHGSCIYEGLQTG